MQSQIRTTAACSPAGWMLTFLHGRDQSVQIRTGLATGPAEWLLEFLRSEGSEVPVRQRPTLLPKRSGADERPAARPNTRSA